ncbi:Cilia- and flagella-associated protein 221 [Phytophthora boehmeriae]|uniref:Cilia- and flagella-associated protein 221 n=1 Tax=Phytophthora boehmeriae TaxID=109152 RepID=A0A8T1X1G8_9STRA|nr:Cilia- and flagella-associated protein 221 [Phytophthora boehmeriae]
MKSSRPASAEQRPLSPPSRSSASSAASPRPRRPTTDQILYAQPASLHFGGFELQRTMQQRVRVHNNSAKSVRFRYTFPTGRKGFRAAFASAERPSFVSAGLSEEIAVSFTPPADFQYYYDCIQVRCEEVAYGSSTDVVRSGSVLIPLHAYPMVNEVSFPTRMDFGVVPRGSCARRQVAITCSVPVEFEYELQITKPHPAFTVFPLSGSIPPRGEARIELEYRPTLYATANAEMELHVSQLGFVPRICMLAGSSSSTAGDAAVDTAEQKRRSPAPPSSEGKSGSQSESQKKTSEASTPRSSANTRSRKTPAEEGPQVDDDHEEEELEKASSSPKI